MHGNERARQLENAPRTALARSVEARRIVSWQSLTEPITCGVGRGVGCPPGLPGMIESPADATPGRPPIINARIGIATEVRRRVSPPRRRLLCARRTRISV